MSRGASISLFSQSGGADNFEGTQLRPWTTPQNQEPKKPPKKKKKGGRKGPPRRIPNPIHILRRRMREARNVFLTKLEKPKLQTPSSETHIDSQSKNADLSTSIGFLISSSQCLPIFDGATIVYRKHGRLGSALLGVKSDGEVLTTLQNDVGHQAINIFGENKHHGEEVKIHEHTFHLALFSADLWTKETLEPTHLFEKPNLGESK